MPASDFIEVTENALSRATCAALVTQFESSADLRPGEVGGGVHRDLKDSADLTISGRPEWRAAEAALNEAMFHGLVAYLRKYPYCAIAPLAVHVAAAPGAAPTRLDEQALRTLPDAVLHQVIRYAFRPGRINLQRYRADQGGYPYWHCELFPRDPDAEQLHRHLLWTIYLNEEFSAGETEFLHQQRSVAPRTGSLLIAPSGFTHTHRGNQPRGGDKYIATSWILFQRSEALYPPA
jgi:hypothetical protein